MKLSAETKHLIKEGSILVDENGNTYKVTTVIELPRNRKQITVRCQDGRNIYAMPLSSYYGLIITERN